MNKKNYIISLREENAMTFKYETKEQAEKAAEVLSQEYGKEVFIFESISSVCHEKEVNEIIDSFDKACEYLNRDDKYNCAEGNRHYTAIQSMFKLVTIAEAWNKADDFTPDFSDKNQYKYFPWFVYSGATAGFAYANTNAAASTTHTDIGSRLCFKTRERAEQFGKQFIDLWNDFLLLADADS
jgi:hypothetical protein